MNTANLIASAAHVARGTGADPHPLRLPTTLSPLQLLHVGAAAAWVAGVVRVAIAYRDPTRGAAAARRFRTPAVGLFAVVVITGIQNADAHFAWGSSWTNLLVIKVLLVAVAVALAAGVGLRRAARAAGTEAGVLGVVAALGLVLGATAPAHAGVVVLASVPASVSAACAHELAGARVAAAVLGGTVQTFRGSACGIAPLGVVTPVDWFDAGVAAADALSARGVASARLLGVDTVGSFSRGVRSVLPDGDDAVFVVAPPSTARQVLPSLVPSARPVVLAPWLLERGTVDVAQRSGRSVLVAAGRDLTDQLAVDYRLASERAGRAPTALGFEGFVRYLAASSGRHPAPARPGLFAVSPVGVLPSDVGHAHEPGGWLPGAALIRL